MKKITKKALGLVGLATVAALTIVAAGIENPASALTPADSVSGDVTIQYVVLDEGKTHDFIESPLNQSKTTNSVIPVRVLYSGTSTIKYSLTYTGADGETITVTLPEYETPVYESGLHDWSFDLSDYDLSYGTYILHADAYGNGTSSDSIEFTYQAVVVTPSTDGKSTVDEDGTAVTSESGDLDINISVSSKENPSYGEVSIYDSAGNRVFSPITGEPITIPFSAGDIASGHISLNLSDYGLTNHQKYTLTFSVYDASGTFIGSDSLNVLYDVIEPDVPNTGGSIFAALNLSNADFLASSLIAFAAMTVVALILIKKSSRR